MESFLAVLFAGFLLTVFYVAGKREGSRKGYRVGWLRGRRRA